MKRIYLPDACHALGIDSATLYRWLKRAGIQVQSDEIDKRKRYITQSDVRTLARQHGKQPPNIYHADIMQTSDTSEYIDEQMSKLTALFDSKLTALTQRVDELEKRMGTQSKILKPSRAEYTVETTPQPTTSMTLPDGLVVTSQFAELHGIPITTVKNAIKNGHLKDVEGRWVVGRATVRSALDAAGRAQFYAMYHERETFESCPDCPH